MTWALGRCVRAGLLGVLLGTAAWAGAPTVARPEHEIGVVARGVLPDATAENSQRKLVVGASDALALAYTRPVAGVSQVFLARSLDQGRTWQYTQVTRSPAPARLASLSAFPDGTLHVVWTEFAPVGRIVHRSVREAQWSQPAILSRPGVYGGVPVVAPAGVRPVVLWSGNPAEAGPRPW